MKILTQLIYKKKWLQTTEKEALKIIEDEMPQTDAKGTLSYILSQIQQGKIITLGECRFKSS